MCSFRRIQKRIFDPRFAGFRGRKEREIRNWICNLGNLSPTRAICTTASQEMTCFLLFDKLCDYTVRILWSAVRIKTMEHKQVKKEARLSGKLSKDCRLSLIQFRSSNFSCIIVTRSTTYRVYKRVCRKIAVHLTLLLICVVKQSLATNGYYMDIFLYLEQSSNN